MWKTEPMHYYLKCVLIVCLSLSLVESMNVVNNNTYGVHIAAFFSYSYPITPVLLESMTLLTTLINASPGNISSKSLQLFVDYYDTDRASPLSVLNYIYQTIAHAASNENKYDIIVSPYDASFTIGTSVVASLFQTVMFTASDTSAQLSDKTIFPYTVQATVNDGELDSSFSGFVDFFGWKRMALIVQRSSFGINLAADLTEHYTSTGITSSLAFVDYGDNVYPDAAGVVLQFTETQAAMDTFLQADLRIYFVDCDVWNPSAYFTVYEFYRRGLLFSGYVMMGDSWMTDGYFRYWSTAPSVVALLPTGTPNFTLSYLNGHLYSSLEPGSGPLWSNTYLQSFLQYVPAQLYPLIQFYGNILIASRDVFQSMLQRSVPCNATNFMAFVKNLTITGLNGIVTFDMNAVMNPSFILSNIVNGAIVPLFTVYPNGKISGRPADVEWPTGEKGTIPPDHTVGFVNGQPLSTSVTGSTLVFGVIVAVVCSWVGFILIEQVMYTKINRVTRRMRSYRYLVVWIFLASISFTIAIWTTSLCVVSSFALPIDVLFDLMNACVGLLPIFACVFCGMCLLAITTPSSFTRLHDESDDNNNNDCAKAKDIPKNDTTTTTIVCLRQLASLFIGIRLDMVSAFLTLSGTACVCLSAAIQQILLLNSLRMTAHYKIESPGTVAGGCVLFFGALLPSHLFGFQSKHANVRLVLPLLYGISLFLFHALIMFSLSFAYEADPTTTTSHASSNVSTLITSNVVTALALGCAAIITLILIAYNVVKLKLSRSESDRSLIVLASRLAKCQRIIASQTQYITDKQLALDLISTARPFCRGETSSFVTNFILQHSSAARNPNQSDNFTSVNMSSLSMSSSSVSSSSSSSSSNSQVRPNKISHCLNNDVRQIMKKNRNLVRNKYVVPEAALLFLVPGQPMHNTQTTTAPISLAQTLSHLVTVEYLKDCLIRSHNDENVLFLLDVARFELLCQHDREANAEAEDEDEVHAEPDADDQEQEQAPYISLGDYIILTYIRAGSPLQINISATIREDILNHASKKQSLLLFVQAKQIVHQLIFMGAWVQFIETGAYAECCRIFHMTPHLTLTNQMKKKIKIKNTAYPHIKEDEEYAGGDEEGEPSRLANQPISQRKHSSVELLFGGGGGNNTNNIETNATPPKIQTLFRPPTRA